MEEKTDNKNLVKQMKTAMKLAWGDRKQALAEYLKIYKEFGNLAAGYNAALLYADIGNIKDAITTMQAVNDKTPNPQVQRDLASLKESVNEQKQNIASAKNSEQGKQAPTKRNPITLSGTANVSIDGAAPSSSPVVYAYTTPYFSALSFINSTSVQGGSWSMTIPPFDDGSQATVYFRIEVNGMSEAAGNAPAASSDSINLNLVNINTKGINGTLKQGQRPLANAQICFIRTRTPWAQVQQATILFGKGKTDSNGAWSFSLPRDVKGGVFIVRVDESGGNYAYYIGHGRGKEVQNGNITGTDVTLTAGVRIDLNVADMQPWQ
jgi:hypothetical protein